MARSDLLDLCGNFPQMKFIIFTNLEDTPIDDFIINRIPENVVCISAINAITYGGKIIPAPYGVQRRMTPDDDRIEQLTEWMEFDNKDNPDKLLYVSHNESSNARRLGIKNLFYDKDNQRVWEAISVLHKAKEPIDRLESTLISDGAISTAEVGQMDTAIKLEVDTAFEYAGESPFPIAESMRADLYAESPEFSTDSEGLRA
mgnify:CR=1 FL=1